MPARDAPRAARRRVRRPRLRALLGDTRGTATVEFVLAFPVLLFLTLLLLQVTLLMVGQGFVHYAAFAATRSAISQIPAAAAIDEPRNTLRVGDGGTKRESIRRAAALALVPVSGRVGEADGSGINTDAFVEALRQYLAATGVGEPNWVQTLIADRVRYAFAHTRVEFLTIHIDEETRDLSFRRIATESHAYGPLDPVTVRVEHDLFLSIPYVWRIFADGEFGGRDGGYARVSSQYTLNNEGVDPAMPPPPALPRDNP